MNPASPVDGMRLLEELTELPVHEQASRLKAIGDVQQALGALIEHASQLTAIDASQAIKATDVVVRLADELGSHLDRARARRARARALSYTGQFEEALCVSTDGIQLAEKAGSAIEAGRSRLASMHALGELGRLNEAIRAGEQARAAFLKAGEQTLAARADINLGIAYHRSDDPATAITCFERARPLVQDDLLVAGHLDNSRGEALVALNDFEGAEQAFSKALENFRRESARLTAAIAEGNLADLATRQGRLQKALLHFEGARRQLEADATPGHLARLLAEQAEAMGVLGMPAEALVQYELALPELEKCGLALEAARARSGMGQVLMQLGRPAQAETALAAAATAFEEIGHATARAKVDLIRAELASGRGRVHEARAIVMRAMAVLHDRPAEQVSARYLLARLALKLGRLEEADADLAAALALAVELDLAPLQADVLFTRGLLRRRQNRLREAADDFSRAIEQVERVRGALHAQRFRAAYLGDRSTMYETLALTWLDVGDQDSVSKSFFVAEQAKGRSLLEQVSGLLDVQADDEHSSTRNASDTAETALLTEMQRIRSELNALYSRFHDDGKSHSRQARKTWSAAVRQREAHLETLENRLAATRGIGGLYAPTADVEQVCSLIDPDEALIEYFIAGEELLAFVLKRGGVQSYRGLALASELTEVLQRLHFQINRALRPGALEGPRQQWLLDDVLQELERLHQQTLAPLQDELQSVRRMTIVPHKALHMLPFHALWNGSQHVIETHEVHYAPSASLLVHLDGHGPAGAPKDGSMLVVGVGDQAAPRINHEARAVAKALHCPDDRLLLDADATAGRVCHAAQDSRIIHLACHGRFVPDTPMGSGLKLADRWLTVRDIYSMRLQADLVTLSGCQTGVNLVKAGDELTGLLRGFFAAGASSLFVSLWQVDDRTTQEFMTGLYGLFNAVCMDHGVKAHVLREAQLQALARHRHPALWAPFILVGKP